MRLFDENATVFDSLGIGELPDASRAEVVEERNGMFELEFDYPVTGTRYGELKLGRIVCCKPSPHAGGDQPFRIYGITRPLDGKVTVDAAHISYDLNAESVGPVSASSAVEAMAAVHDGTAGGSAFTYWTDKETVATMNVPTPSSARSLLGGVEGGVLDVYGGEYEFDTWTVKLHEQRGSDRGVLIEYGKNLVDIRQEENNRNVYTHVAPFWYNADIGLATLDHAVPTGLSGRRRTLTLDLSADESLQSEGEPVAPTSEQLEAACLAYISSHGLDEPKVSIEVDFAELSKAEGYEGIGVLESVWLCDTVHVRFAELGVDATAKVVRGVYDVLADRWSTVELGDARSTLAKTIAAQGESISRVVEEAVESIRGAYAAAIETATYALTGITGGHVVIWNSVTRSPEEPNEILIMDTDSVETAINVWRWNAAGWGHSSTGYAGPYTMGAVLGTGIYADFITAGTLNANLVKAGLLKAALGDSFWNMETGEFLIDKSALMTSQSTTLAGDLANAAKTATNYIASAPDGFVVGSSKWKTYYRSNGWDIQDTNGNTVATVRASGTQQAMYEAFGNYVTPSSVSSVRPTNYGVDFVYGGTYGNIPQIIAAYAIDAFGNLLTASLSSSATSSSGYTNAKFTGVSGGTTTIHFEKSGTQNPTIRVSIGGSNAQLVHVWAVFSVTGDSSATMRMDGSVSLTAGNFGMALNGNPGFTGNVYSMPSTGGNVMRQAVCEYKKGVLVNAYVITPTHSKWKDYPYVEVTAGAKITLANYA